MSPKQVGTRAIGEASLQAANSRMRWLRTEYAIVNLAALVQIPAAFLAFGRFGWWGVIALTVVVAGLIRRETYNTGRG